MAVLPVVALSFASCDNDDNLPDVKFSLSVENAEIVDGTIYVVQGDTLNVTGVSVTNNEAGKPAAVTNVRYFIDGFYLGNSIFAPYPAYNLTTVDTPEGNYQLGITCTILAEDKSIAIGNIIYPIKVVAASSDIPDGPAVTTSTRTMSVKN